MWTNIWIQCSTYIDVTNNYYHEYVHLLYVTRCLIYSTRASLVLMLLISKSHVSWIKNCGNKYCIFLFFTYMYSLRENNLGDAGAQALAEGLHHCTNLQKLE